MNEYKHKIRPLKSSKINKNYKIHNISYVNNIEHITSNVNIKLNTNNNDSKFYISLTSTPVRFFSIEFNNVLDILCNQNNKPYKVYVSICNKYKRDFIYKSLSSYNKRINYLESLYDNLKIIKVNDYGPATKILGILEYNNDNNFLNNYDRIIIVDDDMYYSKNMYESHKLCHQLYNCDISVVNERNMLAKLDIYKFKEHDIFYTDNYNGFIYGWLSFCISVKSLKNIFTFYNKIIKEYPEIFFHDDLLWNIYNYQEKLYAVENRFITLDVNKSRTMIDKYNPLREHKFEAGNKYYLEREVYNDMKIYVKSQRFINKKTNYTIDYNIPKRNFYLVENIDIINQHDDIHFIPTYLDKNYFMLTITIFNPKLLYAGYELEFKCNDERYSIFINLESTKFSCIIKINTNISYLDYYNPYSYKIMQTNKELEMSKNRFNSILTILNNAPEYEHIFYDNKKIYTFMEKYYSSNLIELMNNLIPGAYLSDLFRYCYLYLNGGIYFDCKKILYIPISKFINTNNEYIFVKDDIYNYVYNAIIFCKKENIIIKEALYKITYNIINNVYGDDPLCVTGPGLLGNILNKHTNYKYDYFNIIPYNNCVLSYVVNRKNKKIIKNTYYGYYNENNYINVNHYHNLWVNKNIYKKDFSKIYNVNNKIDDSFIFNKTNIIKKA